MFFKYWISWWNSSKLEHSLKALCNNVKIKAYLYELGIKLPKLVNTPLNVGLRLTDVVNLLFSSTILMSRKDKKWGKLYISMLEVKVIFEIFSLIDIMKKEKSAIKYLL